MHAPPQHDRRPCSHGVSSAAVEPHPRPAAGHQQRATLVGDGMARVPSAASSSHAADPQPQRDPDAPRARDSAAPRGGCRGLQARGDRHPPMPAPHCLVQYNPGASAMTRQSFSMHEDSCMRLDGGKGQGQGVTAACNEPVGCCNTSHAWDAVGAAIHSDGNAARMHAGGSGILGVRGCLDRGLAADYPAYLGFGERKRHRAG